MEVRGCESHAEAFARKGVERWRGELAAIGMSLAYIPATMTGMGGAAPQDTGLASRLIITTYEVGSAHGPAIMVSLAISAGSAAGPERIEGKDREIYDQGLIGNLRDLHDQIDREVAAAYGWPADLSDDEILHRLVDLNRERKRLTDAGHFAS
jgi:hypothetical protein